MKEEDDDDDEDDNEDDEDDKAKVDTGQRGYLEENGEHRNRPTVSDTQPIVPLSGAWDR